MNYLEKMTFMVKCLLLVGKELFLVKTLKRSCAIKQAWQQK